MRGYKRFRAGAWRLTVEGPTDPTTGKRQQVNRTVRAPNNRAGEKAADIELAKLIVEVDARRTLPSTGLTVAQLIERYIVAQSHKWSPREPDNSRSRARAHLYPYIGDTPVDRLRPVDVSQLYTTLRGGGLAEASVRKVHDLLHAALNWAWRHDLIASNPAAKADKPSQRKGRRTAPPDEVLAALIRAAQGDLLCYLRLSAVTGARRGQLVALRWSDLDLERGTVTFTRAHVVVKGGVAEKGTKTNHDYGVALDPGTVDLLKVHRVRCAERALAAGVGLLANGFVFARANAPDGSEAWHPDGATQRFDRLRARVPGGADVTLHQLRHWMATSMFEAGFDPVAVAARGGWASPTVPMNVYGHFRKARDHDAAASLAARLDNKG